jgi:glucokinase-like ROK family protein
MLKSTKKTTRDLRRSNRLSVLSTLYFGAPLSRLDLSQLSGLSPATVTNVIAELLDEQIVRETGSLESDGGRPRTMLEVNTDYGTVVGIELGETHLRLELFDLTLHNLGFVHYTLPDSEKQPDQYVDTICRGLDELIITCQKPVESLIGIGIGLPGVVEHDSTINVYAPQWGWQKVPLLEMLKARISSPIYMDNGAKAMALAESWFGAGKGYQDLVVLLLGTGVGAGIITQGGLYRGKSNSAGEWGHTKIVLDGRSCRCGSHGCLEAYVGALAIIERFREIAPNEFPETSDQWAVLGRIVSLAEEDDPSAKKILEDTAHYLGAGIANLINLFNPELIVLGGWAGLNIGGVILPRVQHFARSYALKQPMSVGKIGLCELGQDAICMGAASLVLEGFFSEPLDKSRRSKLAPEKVG